MGYISKNLGYISETYGIYWSKTLVFYGIYLAKTL